MVVQSLSGASGEQFAVKALFNTETYAVPADATVLKHAIRIRLSKTDGNLIHSGPCLQNNLTTWTIRREQLVDCRPGESRRFCYLGSSHAQVQIRYLEFTDDAIKKNPHLHYGYVLQEQSIYLALDKVDQAERLIEQIRFLLSSGSVGLKPYLVFVNPCSGAGKALSMFKNTVAPMFNRLHIPYVLFKTKYPGHAESWIQRSSTEVLTKYRALLTISGDGLIYEIINGLAYRDTVLYNASDVSRSLDSIAVVSEVSLRRDDHDAVVSRANVLGGTGELSRSAFRESIAAKSRISIPLGFLPAGGGNATASAVCYVSGLASREKCLLHSAFLLSHNPPSTQPPLPPVRSSDSAERPTEQQLCPLDAILFETMEPHTQRIGILSVEWGGLADLDLLSERFRWLGQTRFALATLISMARNKEFRAKVSYLPALRSNANESETANMLEPQYTPTDTTVSQNEVTDSGLPWTASRCSPIGQQMWSRRYLPATDEPLPIDWVTVSDSFWTVLITNHSHIATDAMLHPRARFDNGQLNLVLIYSHVKCSDLFGLSQHLATGDGMRDTSYWKIIPVLAVRVEPEVMSTYTMLDGEVVQSGSFQVEVVPRQFSVITCPVIHNNVNNCSPESSTVSNC